MIIYIASDGQARLVSPQHVYQGSNVTDITVVAPFPPQTAMTVAFSLPDGKMFGGVQGTVQTPSYEMTPPYMMTLLANQPELPDNVYAWQYVMSSAITQNAGQAKVSITAQFAQGSGKTASFTQQTSAQVEFTIEPSVVGTLPDEPTEDAWKQIIDAIAETQSNVTANASDIEDIVDGATAVGKAVADQKGNVIDETYATKTALDEAADDASEALEIATKANTTAQEAKTTADGIDAKATTALETSNEASSNAAQALQKANAATETANAAQAAVASKQDATDDNLDTTDKTVVGAINENKTAIDGLRQDILNEAHFRGYFATNAEIQATTANLNDFAYSAQSGTVWIYGESGWADSGKPVPDKTTPLSDATPIQDGTATAGASASAARGDHVHPTDNTRAAKSTVDSIISGAQVVGKATKATQDANGNVIDETYATKTELVETTGTEVKVNGATQSEVNFTSDPQTQITANKNAIAEAQSDINDIIDGSQTVGKAEQDADGNVIKDTYAKLSQVVRTDTAQTLNDSQKQTARNNTTTFISKGLPSAGWYRIAELSTSGFFEFQFNSVYYATPPSPCKVFVSWGAQDSDKYSLTSINSNSASPIVQSVRLISVENKWCVDFYYNGTLSQDVVGIVMSGISYNDEFAQITPIDFTPVGNTGTVLTSLDITPGINTTGGVYQQGAPVFATDPSKLAPSTANGWTQTTATGTLPSAGVYMIAVYHTPSDTQPHHYYNPAILVYDGAVGSCTMTDDTGVLLISMVVTPSGIQLARPVSPGSAVQSTNIYYKRIA